MPNKSVLFIIYQYITSLKYYETVSNLDSYIKKVKEKNDSFYITMLPGSNRLCYYTEFLFYPNWNSWIPFKGLVRIELYTCIVVITNINYNLVLLNFDDTKNEIDTGSIYMKTSYGILEICQLLLSYNLIKRCTEFKIISKLFQDNLVALFDPEAMINRNDFYEKILQDSVNHEFYQDKINILRSFDNLILACK